MRESQRERESSIDEAASRISATFEAASRMRLMCVIQYVSTNKCVKESKDSGIEEVVSRMSAAAL